MGKDFLSFVRRPGSLLRILRQVTVGGVIAATGTTVAPSTGEAAEIPKSEPPTSVMANVLDRSRKGVKLVLSLPGHVGFLGAAHRSHQSHRSHVSSSSGGSTAPRPAPARPADPPPPTRPAPDSARTLGLAALPATGTAVSGEVVAIDTDARTITIRPTATTRTTFGYRDDSKFQTALGVPLRFDDFSDANNGRLPIAAGDKVEIQWRTSTDGKIQLITTVQKKP